MQIKYHRLDVADCTSDPHYVAYSEEDKKAVLKAMFDDIIKVCESDMVQGVRNTRATIGDKHYESDSYSTSDWRKKGKLMKGKDAERAKIAGLYFDGEPDHDEVGEDGIRFSKDLPSGLLGIKRLAEEVLKNPDGFEGCKIGVVWGFAGDHSCSDYIEIGSYMDWAPGGDVVNYGSQDWWIDNEGYIPWCDGMEELLNKEFPRAR